MESTQGHTSSSDRSSPWTITLACSSRPDALGRAVEIPRGTARTLGRQEDLFARDALGDPRVSRRHAELLVDEAGICQIRDLGSHNGTYVNGARIDRAALHPNDVVRIGDVLLHVDDGRRWPGLRALEQQLLRLDATQTILITGGPGSGKDWCARRFHDLFAPDEAFVVMHCTSLGDGRHQEALTDALARAGSGTVYLDDVDALSDEAQRLLLGALRHGSYSDGRVDIPFGARVVASRRDAADARLLPALETRLGAWTLYLPPLSARRRDIPALVAAILREARGEVVGVHPSLMLNLLSTRGPDDLHQLRAHVLRACRETKPGERIRNEESTLRRRPKPEPDFIVDARGTWFRAKGEERVDIANRPVLRALLGALVRAHRGSGGVVPPEKLINAAWPDERLAASVAKNRLYVALSTLRKLGLDEALERTRSGYRLRTDVAVE